MSNTRVVLATGWNISRENLFVLAEILGLTPIEAKDTLADYASDIAAEMGCEADVRGDDTSPDICIFVAQELPCDYDELAPFAVKVLGVSKKIQALNIELPIPTVWAMQQEIKE